MPLPSGLSIPDLPTRLREIDQLRQDRTISILGDASLRYAAIVQIIDIAKAPASRASASLPKACDTSATSI
jgi:biopolymer transport protein ExbD